MTIPKRRSYKIHAMVFIAVCTAFSSVLISLGGALVQAVATPNNTRNEKSTSEDQRTDRRDNRHDNKNDAHAVSQATVVTPAQSQKPQTTQKTNVATTKSTSVVQQPSISTTPKVTVAAAPVTTEVVSQTPDTSTAARQLAINQSQHAVQPSVYTSAKISGFERDQFYKTGYVIAAASGLLYLMSFVKVASQWVHKGFTPERRTTTVIQ